MAGKSAVPLVLGAGVAAYLLMPKKKKAATTTKKNGNGAKTDSNIVLSGKSGEWEWRVRKEPGQPGFASLHWGEVKSPKSAISWEKAHEKGMSKADDAKLLALEYIAKAQAAEAEQKFNWEPARSHNEAKLREQYPGVSLSVLETGSQMNGDVKCHWAIMDVLPPIDPGAYAGFMICPATNEQVSRFSNSIAAIKTALEIA